MIFELMSTADDFFLQNAIIPQPPRNDVIRRTSQILLIDSRDRDSTEYPEPNAYVIELPDEYRDVVSLELLNYDVPTQQYTIRAGINDRLHFGVVRPTITVTDNEISIDYHKSNFLSVTIPAGYYEEFAEDVLGQCIQDRLNALSLSQFQVLYNRALNKYTFTTDFSNPLDENDALFFQMFFLGTDDFYLRQSVGPILGFGKKDPQTLLSGVVATDPNDATLLCGTATDFQANLLINDWLYLVNIYDDSQRYRAQVLSILSPNRLQLDRPLPNLEGTRSLCWRGRIEAPWVRNINPDPYIILKLRGINTIASTNNIVNRCFTYIATRKHNFEIRENMTSIKFFNPIMARMSRLQIEFLNYDGSKYDFNGLNHVLVFRLERFSQNINFVQGPDWATTLPPADQIIIDGTPTTT